MPCALSGVPERSSRSPAGASPPVLPSGHPSWNSPTICLFSMGPCDQYGGCGCSLPHDTTSPYVSPPPVLWLLSNSSTTAQATLSTLSSLDLTIWRASALSLAKKGSLLTSCCSLSSGALVPAALPVYCDRACFKARVNQLRAVRLTPKLLFLQVIFALTATGHLWRTDNGGVTWCASRSQM